MKLFMTSLLIAAIVALAPLAGAEAGLREGRAAYAQGDYATALEEILPLADAQRLLGVMCRQGQGAAKDAERALYWTQQAVAQGDAPAQFNLANMYEAGDTVAQYRLGAFFLEGQGGVRDPVLAFVWYSRAAANERSGGLAGHAAKARDKIARSLSESEKARGATIMNKTAKASEGGSGTARVPRKRSAGTGFIVSADGHILTNNHVVAGCAEVRIKPLVVPVLAQDAALDLALLKLGAKFKRFATFRDGESVVVTGFPLPGLLASDLKITTGTVSGRAGPGNNKNLIQLSRRCKRAITAGRSWICRAMWSAW